MAMVAPVAGAAARGAATKAAASGAGTAATKTAASGAGATTRGAGAAAAAPAPSPASKAPETPAPKGSASFSPASALRGGSSSSSVGTPAAYRKVARAANPTAIANAGGGALLGAVTYVLALTYLRGGREGVKAWMRAKFLNQVPGSAR